MAGVDYAPIPLVRYRDDLADETEYRPDPDAYARAVYTPSVAAELLEQGKTRSLQIGTLRLFPVQVNAATRSIRRYTRMVVEVRYGGASAGPILAADLAFLGSGLVNAQAAQSWSRARVPTF